MDPDANLAEQRRLAHKLLNPCDGDMPDEDDVRRLAELVEALDDWMSNAGFLPGAWSRNR
jgi:hypothetical protein